jgi:hypothetical protein
VRSTLHEDTVTGDEHRFTAVVSRRDGTDARYAITVTGPVAAVWCTSPGEAAAALAAAIDQAGPEPLPSHFRFGSETVPPSLPLGAICQTIVMGKWAAFVGSTQGTTTHSIE